MRELTARVHLEAAARATLDVGSARVWACWFADTGEVSSSEEGVSDFAGHRTRTTTTPGPGLMRWATLIEERFPWLPGDDDEDGSPACNVFAGTASFFGSGDHWIQMAKGEPSARKRVHTDPAWILDVLSQAEVSGFRRDGTDTVRGESCERYAFAVDFGHAALELPPHPGSRPVAIEIPEFKRPRRGVWVLDLVRFYGELRRRRRAWTASSAR